MRLMDGGSGGGPTAYDNKHSTPKPYQPTTDNGRSAYVRKTTAAKPKVTPKKTTTIKPSSRVVSARTVTTPTTYTPTTKPTIAPTTYTPATITTSGPSYSTLSNNYLNQLTNTTNKVYDQQKAATLAQLKADQQAAVSKLNGQKKDTAVAYQGQRNQADVVAAQNVQKLRELMASNGLNASGENVTAQASASSDRQNSINALNLQQQSAISGINNQINDLNNPARQQAALAQIESERSKALLDNQNTAQEKAWREYTYNNMSANEKATLEWAKQQYGEDAAWKMYELQTTTAASIAQSQAEVNAYTGATSTSGGGGIKTTGTTPFNQNLQSAAAKANIPSSWLNIMTEIAKRESGFNPQALNKSSGTYGYAQFQEYNVDSYNKKYGLDYRNNPVDQLVAMYHYIQDRYGTAENALKWWDSHHWY
jgi:hypothetical protein